MRALSLTLIFLSGLAAGWLLHDRFSAPDATGGEAVGVKSRQTQTRMQPDSPDLQTLVEQHQFRHVVEDLSARPQRLAELARKVSLETGLGLLRTASEVRGETFEVTMAMAALQADHGNYAAAVDLLLRAAMLVRNEAQETELENKLDAVTRAYARELVAGERFDVLDSLYQTITLTLPEQAEYFLKLGRLRMRMGDFDSALVPLSHIENDRQWGERARELMAQAEASEVSEGPAREELALHRQGSQFVVKAMIDHNRVANLLIDTGAAMTMIDAALLEQLGYSLGDQRWEYFSTANGVVEAPVVSIRHLGLGSTGIKELPVGALLSGFSNGIEGLLGMNFLRHYEFRIDQNRNLLYLDMER